MGSSEWEDWTVINRVPIEELKSICGGSRARMMATLHSWGLPALPDIDGCPIVLRADLERVLRMPSASRPIWKRPRLDAVTI